MSKASIRHDSFLLTRKPDIDKPGPSPVYQTLDQTQKQIRLLVVEPGSQQSPIRCTFRIASLMVEAAPAYETISYVWGDATLRSTVFVNDHELTVPRSAEIVLRHMRYTDRPRTLWIDALCIWQQNVDDRNYQVQLMCDIYSRASRGLIWLGEDTGDAGEIFEVMQALYNEAEQETEGFRTFKETVWPRWFAVYGAPTRVQLKPELIAQFFDMPWFSRLWVVQEAALTPSSTCHYGSYTIPLLRVLRAATWLYSKSKSLPAPLAGHRGMARAVHVASYTDPEFATPFRTESNLLYMMNTLQQYDTSVGKDHVYGLVGMYQRFLPCNVDLPRELIPNYSRSTRDILSDAAICAMRELEQADVFLYVCHRSSEEVEAGYQPSWVPQWNRKLDLAIDPPPLNSDTYEASQHIKLDLSCTAANASGTLSVNGFVIDQIQEFTEVFTPEVLRMPQHLLSLLRSVEAVLDERACNAGDLELTLVSSLDHKRAPMSKSQSTVGYRALLEHLISHNEIPTFEKAQISPELNIGAAYHEAMSRWLKNRRVFTTKLGYLGIGPKVMQKADLVAILYGCRVPIILRRHKQMGTYVMVGPTYVNGVMSGEAVDWHKGGGNVDERFDIV